MRSPCRYIPYRGGPPSGLAGSEGRGGFEQEAIGKGRRWRPPGPGRRPQQVVGTSMMSMKAANRPAIGRFRRKAKSAAAAEVNRKNRLAILSARLRPQGVDDPAEYVAAVEESDRQPVDQAPAQVHPHYPAQGQGDQTDRRPCHLPERVHRCRPPPTRAPTRRPLSPPA